MKQSILSILFLLSVCITKIIAQSNDQNYIISIIPDSEVLDVSALNNSNSNATIQYFDGLGRPVESVQQAISPLGKDIISTLTYDVVGRESRHWLPAPSTNNDGKFMNVTAFKSIQKGFYNDSQPADSIINDLSPLNRILGKYGAGSAWFSAGRKVTTSFGTNTSNESPVYSYIVNSSNQLQCAGTYPKASLYKTTVTDEDGKFANEYKDKLGRVVLKRRYSNIDTYYVYNEQGRLSYVLPPLAASNMMNAVVYPDNNTYLTQFGYIYKYDESGNCIYKQLPGCAAIYMLYDNADRLILSQNGNQRNNKQWIVTKYDVFGRVLYTAVLNREVSSNEKSNIHSSVVIESIGTDNPLDDTGYTCNTFPNELSPLIVNYYDNYNFLTDMPNNMEYQELNGFDKAFSISEGDPDNLNERGILTGARTYFLNNSGEYILTAMYYDDKARIVQTRSSNHLNGYDIVYNAYNFNGLPLKTLKTHGINNESSTITELYTYTYDKAKRPKTTRYQLNGGSTVLLDSIIYDELGRVSYQYRHNKTDIESYAYNIRNWTTQISSGNPGNNFTENLYYNVNLPSGAIACYNGNIAASTWTYGTGTKGYIYGYDALNRCAGAIFRQGTSTQVSGAFDESFTYDIMGNIKTLKRKKDNTLIDDLTFHYKNNASNQLDYISDAAGSQSSSSVKEYQNLSTATYSEMAYDANGNMIKDLDRDIATIKYNLLNLPEYIQFSNGNVIKNLYDAGGQKLRSDYYTYKQSLSEPLTDGEILAPIYTPTNYDFSGTEYVENIEYKISKTRGPIRIGMPMLYKDSYTFSRLYNTEGYVENLSSPNYYYYRKDHLGSNREVWQAPPSGGGGAGTTVQRTQYYPSGLPWAENLGGSVQNMKYNSKEFMEMHGWDESDLGARGIHQARVQFDEFDPLAENHYDTSPYALCGNNTLSRIDPNGMDWDNGFEWESSFEADWFQNEKTGALFYNNEYGKEDAGKKGMDGDGWSWLGPNDMFMEDSKDMENSDNAIVQRYGGSINYIPNILKDQIPTLKMSLSLGGETANKFMDRMGYKQQPSQQVIWDLLPQTKIQGAPRQPKIELRITERSTYLKKGAIETGISALLPVQTKISEIGTENISRYAISYSNQTWARIYLNFFYIFYPDDPIVLRGWSEYGNNIDLINKFKRKYGTN